MRIDDVFSAVFPRVLAWLCGGVCAVALSGCAIRPLPEDASGVSTYHIVRRIRCETRKAVADSVFGYVEKRQSPDPQALAIVQTFREGRPIQELRPEIFPANMRPILNLFWDTGVAYNFNLEMSEKNNLDGEVDFSKVFSLTKEALAIKAGVDRSRKNTRTFTVTDTFRSLLNDIHDDYCADFIVAENHVYPITGRIGMDKMIHDFVNLTLFGGLAGKEGTAGPPTLVDALEFQTTLNGSANPSVTFMPGRALSVASATLTAAATRVDTHKLVVGLAISKQNAVEVGPTRSQLFGRLLTASGGGSRKTAALAVEQFLTQQLFSPTIVVQ